MKKFVALGTECVEYLKATRASEGNLLSYILLALSAFFASLFDFLFPFLNFRCFGGSECSHFIAGS
jgi:hypothetical protein